MSGTGRESGTGYGDQRLPDSPDGGERDHGGSCLKSNYFLSAVLKSIIDCGKPNEILTTG